MRVLLFLVCCLCQCRGDLRDEQEGSGSQKKHQEGQLPVCGGEESSIEAKRDCEGGPRDGFKTKLRDEDILFDLRKPCAVGRWASHCAHPSAPMHSHQG